MDPQGKQTQLPKPSFEVKAGRLDGLSTNGPAFSFPSIGIMKWVNHHRAGVAEAAEVNLTPQQ
jgi:hypothetical protein